MLFTVSRPHTLFAGQEGEIYYLYDFLFEDLQRCFASPGSEGGVFAAGGGKQSHAAGNHQGSTLHQVTQMEKPKCEE